MSWGMRSIGEVCNVIPGFAFKSKDLGETGIPVVKIGNITDDYRVDIDSVQHLPENLFKEMHEKFMLANDDIVIAMTGATAGKIGRIRCPKEQVFLLNQRVAKFKPRNINLDFFWSAISTPRYRTIFYRLGGGVAQPNMSSTQIEEVKIPYPPPNVQDRIASILSAYDELIENNRRRIQLLEQAARLLYKEWFVHLRFPGHEHTTVIDSVPEGWERKTLGDVVDVTKGKNITKDSAKDGFVPVVAGGLSPAYYHDNANAVGPVITVSTSGANAGYVNLYHEDIWASDCSYISRASTELLYYFYLLLSSKQKIIFGLQKGAAQPHVYPKDLKMLPLFDPPETLTKLFEEAVSHNFLQLKGLFGENKLLKRARDLLLPRLMNGEITI